MQIMTGAAAFLCIPGSCLLLLASLFCLLTSVRKCVLARTLLTPKARSAKAVVTKKIKTSSRGVPIYGLFYFFDASRDDGTTCRVEQYAGDVPYDVYQCAVKGHLMDVRYLPHAPAKCMLACDAEASASISGSCKHFKCDTLLLQLFGIILPCVFCIALIVVAFENGWLPGTLSVALCALALLVWIYNIQQIANFLDRFVAKPKEIGQGDADFVQHVAIGMPVVANSSGQQIEVTHALAPGSVPAEA